MAEQKLTFTGANGVAASSANSGFDTINAGGGSMVFDSSWQPDGVNSLRGTAVLNQSGVVYGTKAVDAAMDFAFWGRVMPKELPSAEGMIEFYGSGTGATRVFALGTTNTGLLRIRDAGASGGTNVYSSAAGVFQVNHPMIISGLVHIDPVTPANGKMRVMTFEDDGVTVRSDSGSTPFSGNFGTAPIVSMRRGGARATTGTLAGTFLWGEPKWEVGATALIPNLPPPPPAAQYIWEDGDYHALEAWVWEGSDYVAIENGDL